MQRALDESTGGSGVLFGRSGWSGRQRLGVLWGGDQASDFWSLRVLVAATLTAAASGFSNWSHDVGGYLGRAAGCALPEGAAPALAPVRLLHAAAPVTRALPAGGLDLRRADARALPRVPAAARAARAVRQGGGGDRSALRAADHRDRCVWWIQPTAARLGDPRRVRRTALRCGSRRCSRRALGERRVELPRGDWIDFWTRERVAWRPRADGRGAARADPGVGALGLDPGHTYPAEHVAAGLGDTPRPSARSRPPSGASPSWAPPESGWPTALASAGGGASGRWTANARSRSRSAEEG